jgi:hypothetical protein
MVDNKRLLDGSSSDFSQKNVSYGEASTSLTYNPSELFSSKPIAKEPGTFILTKKETAPGASIAARLQGSGPRIGKEISGTKLSPEEEKDKKRREGLRESLSLRLIGARNKKDFIFKLLTSSGLADAYGNIEDVESSISDGLLRMEELMIENSIQKNSNESLRKAGEAIALGEDILRDLERGINEEIKRNTKKELPVTIQEEASRIAELEKNLHTKEQAEGLRKKLTPLYGRIAVLGEKIKTTEEEGTLTQENLRVLTHLFTQAESTPTEENISLLSTKLEQQEKSLKNKTPKHVTQEEKLAIHENIASISTQTAYPSEELRKTLRSPASSRDRRVITLKQKTGENKTHEERTIPVADWKERERTVVFHKEKVEAKKKVFRAQGGSLLRIHKNMFAKNPKKYMEVYGTKTDWVERDLNKQAHLNAPKEYLAELAEKKLELRHEAAKLHVEILNQDKEDVKLIHQINSLNSEIEQTENLMSEASAAILSTKQTTKTEPEHNKTLAELKEMYSPATEKIRTQKPKSGLFGFFNKDKKENLRETSQKNTSVSKEISISTQGMTTGQERAPEQTHATFNTTTSQETQKEQSVSSLENSTPEAKKIRTERVATLFDKIIKNKGNNLKKLIVAFGLVVGTEANVHFASQKNIAKTLEQVTSWKDYFQTSEEREFLKDFMGTQELGFEGILKKYAPSIKIDTANPSVLASISEAECVKLLNSPVETIYGLNQDQRIEICNLLRQEEKILQATESHKKMKADFTQTMYTYTNELMTVRGLFEEARKAAEQANNDEVLTKRV